MNTIGCVQHDCAECKKREEAQTVEPAGNFIAEGRDFRGNVTTWAQVMKGHGTPLYYAASTQPAAVPSSEREALIKRLRYNADKRWGMPTAAVRLLNDAADMLAADAKPTTFIQERAQLEQEWCELRKLKRVAADGASVKPPPLTIDQIEEVAGSCIPLNYRAFARAIEAAHGITGEPA